MPTPTYVALAKTVLTGTQAQIDFNSIVNTYNDLLITYTARFDGSGGSGVNINFNSSTTSFTNRYLQGNGSAASSGANFNRFAGAGNLSTETSNTFSNCEIYIPNYTSSNNKCYSVSAVSENGSTQAYIFPIAGLWSNTAAITSISLVPMSGSFVSGSRFDLYGIKNS